MSVRGGGLRGSLRRGVSLTLGRGIASQNLAARGPAVFLPSPLGGEGEERQPLAAPHAGRYAATYAARLPSQGAHEPTDGRNPGPAQAAGPPAGEPHAPAAAVRQGRRRLAAHLSVA